MYRKDPVSGTRCRRGARYGKLVYRRPRTTQEIRLYYAYPEYVRGSRRPNRLPEHWDDTLRESTFNHKCWKLYRRTQWKFLT